MKKIPQPDELDDSAATADEAGADAEQATPLMPGTEQARSLGDMMREAEAVEAAKAEAAPAAAAPSSKSKRVKKVSRSQSRRFARERALQALYQWDVSVGQSSDVRGQFLDDQDMSRVDVDYFTHLFNGVSHNPDAVDEVMSDALDRPIADLDPIERAVLRIAAFELTQCPDIPARVVINEGIEITKRFGADKGHRYVNGVLDKLATAVRPLEMKRR
ncbi:MAG: transcription antitermination factor NusB [Granulosicoccus sp.]